MAPMDLLSHVVSFSPLAGFRKVGVVVVVAMGNVVETARVEEVVAVDCAAEVPHPERAMMKGIKIRAFFTGQFCQ